LYGNVVDKFAFLFAHTLSSRLVL